MRSTGGLVLAFFALLACAREGSAFAGGFARGPAARRTAGVRRSLVVQKDTPATADLSDVELAAQITKLDAITKQLRKETAQEKFDEAQLLGWCPQAEVINGRFSMFFFVVGLITEQITGESVPQQIITMAEVVGILPPA